MRFLCPRPLGAVGLAGVVMEALLPSLRECLESCESLSCDFRCGEVEVTQGTPSVDGRRGIDQAQGREPACGFRFTYIL